MLASYHRSTSLQRRGNWSTPETHYLNAACGPYIEDKLRDLEDVDEKVSGLPIRLVNQT
jgi:hypothetical protein